MLFTSKSNTNATTNTTATETTETTNNNGGLLKGIAIGVGTLAGIGAAYFGHKVYKSHHVVADENNLEDANVDDEEGSENVTENNETVESFNEVDTEETNESAPVEAEEAKTEETKNEAPVEAEEAKTEEIKNEAPVEDEKPSATQLVDQLETEASVFEKEMVLPIEVKTGIEQMDFLMGRIAQCRRTIGDNARISVALRKMQNGVKDFWLGINAKLARQASELESLDVIEDLFGADMDMVDRAYFDMQYINKSTLVLGTKDATVQLFNRLVRVTDKMSKKSSTKSTGETQTVENAFDAFKDGHKETNKVEGETKTSTKPSAGETKTAENCFDAFKDGHKETNKVEGETKTSTKSSDENQKLLDSIDTVMEEIPVLHPERCDMRYRIRCMGGYIHKLNKDSLDKEELDQLRGYCADMTAYANRAIRNISREKITDVDGIHGALGDIKMIADEFVASGVMEFTYTPKVEKRTFNNRYKAAVERLNDAKAKMTAGENKTAKPVVDETQATTKESPSETQIGNSTVISDDGETVTLRAEVSKESIDNVNEVIDIVSKIPNRDHPEMNDMVYLIRVIEKRIQGITEPEATFLAYDDATKSNRFMDACVDMCNLVGNAICNLAKSDKDPLNSMYWIDNCTDNLIASSIISNTYNPDSYRSIILEARTRANGELSKRVTPEIMEKHNRGAKKQVSDETQADASSSNENQVEEPLTYTMSEKIQEAVAVQQSDETAATTAPESKKEVQMSPEALELMGKLQEAGKLITAEKWSEAAEFYKTQLTPYLADNAVTDELRDAIMSIKTKATNMLMSQKQLEAKQKAAAAKASKKKSSRRRRR